MPMHMRMPMPTHTYTHTHTHTHTRQVLVQSDGVTLPKEALSVVRLLPT